MDLFIACLSQFYYGMLSEQKVFSTLFIKFAVLDGEVAVPCNLQSAIAGLNSYQRSFYVRPALYRRC
ncbi:hypothetical protein C2W64_01116 [Brevibacillus laterosporus]|nr:hypothetical protein C2W64_01116 [Brevibacillus laterosporus]